LNISVKVLGIYLWLCPFAIIRELVEQQKKKKQKTKIIAIGNNKVEPKKREP